MLHNQITKICIGRKNQKLLTPSRKRNMELNIYLAFVSAWPLTLEPRNLRTWYDQTLFELELIPCSTMR